jgi:predicted HTH domain antitoxin
MSQITIDVPDASLADMHLTTEAMTRDMRVAMAIGLFAEGRLTHFQAARLAGMGRVEFSERLVAAHVPVHCVTADDFALEFGGG